MSPSHKKLRSNRFAVVDIGSNTAKLTAYECVPDHPPHPLFHDSDTVRIGFQVSSAGEIAPDRATRLIQTLARFEQDCRAYGCDQFLAVATQAFRIASNSDDVVEQIHNATSWQVQILTGEEETQLTIQGASPWLVASEWNVVADIGGASTEVISVSPDGAIWRSGSVGIGSGRLFDEEIQATPPPPHTMETARNSARAALIASGLLPEHAPILLLPGGSGHFLSKLLAGLSPAQSFNTESLETLNGWLSDRRAEETASLIDVQLERAQVLPASLAIVEALVSLLESDKIIAVPSGIADGAARSFCETL